MQLQQLDANNPEQDFPALRRALRDPNGLLAFGGCLAPQRLVSAYRQGIFPWYGPDEPILWWSPDPRLVLFPDKLKISRSLHKTLRKQSLDLRYDSAFEQVVRACAAPRPGHDGTWIVEDMLQAYCRLHDLGLAHSYEAWQHGRLVGGLYGVAIGRVFFGESMFHRQTDASKIAFVHLAQQLMDWGYRLIDCQVSSNHLLSLGAEELPRSVFAEMLQQWCAQPPHTEAWQK